ncbi:hypothetical protein [Leifsonia sp. 2MCAF36]|uniref:hypothetical protein n=1 Tax=Leifsonia sp. 2MCAF36 TaxID=3232988 RepID=UPI003F9AF8B5
MTRSTRIRFGALAAAAAVVAGGLFAAAPAHAANGTITAANTTFTAGNWGSGLTITGSGFTPGSTATFLLSLQNLTVIDTHVATAPVDATGAFTETYIPPVGFPTLAPGAGLTLLVRTDVGDLSNFLSLTVNPALPPKGIQARATTVTTAELADPNTGVSIHAAGYNPGELVTATVVYGGSTDTVGPHTAAADGTVDFGLSLAAGLAVAGTMNITVVGGTSGVSQSIDITVTGPDVLVDGSEPSTAPVIDAAETPASSASTSAAKLPVVSG